MNNDESLNHTKYECKFKEKYCSSSILEVVQKVGTSQFVFLKAHGHIVSHISKICIENSYGRLWPSN